MNLFGELRKESSQFTKRMEYGIHENVVLKGVDITPRFKKDTNVQINALLFFQYSELNAEGVEIAQAEQMVFNMDPNPKTDEKNTKRKIWGRDLQKFTEILSCYYTVDQIDGLMNQIFTQMGINSENFEGALSVADNMKKFCEFLKNSTHAALQPVLGTASDVRLRLKITYDKQGYAQVANFNFVEPSTVNPSGLSMDDYDEKMLAGKRALDAKKQAEAVAGKVGGPGTPSTSPAGSPTATAPAPVTTPAVNTAPIPAGTPAAAAPVATNPVAAQVSAPFQEKPEAIPAAVAIPVVG